MYSTEEPGAGTEESRLRRQLAICLEQARGALLEAEGIAGTRGQIDAATAKPALRAVETLLAQAERMNESLAALDDLSGHGSRCVACVSGALRSLRATLILLRDSPGPAVVP